MKITVSLPCTLSCILRGLDHSSLSHFGIQIIDNCHRLAKPPLAPLPNRMLGGTNFSADIDLVITAISSSTLLVVGVKTRSLLFELEGGIGHKCSS